MAKEKITEVLFGNILDGCDEEHFGDMLDVVQKTIQQSIRI